MEAAARTVASSPSCPRAQPERVKGRRHLLTTETSNSKHAYWLGVGIASLANLFDTEAVVLGGLLGRLLPFIETELKTLLNRRLLPAQAETPIMASALGIDAAVVGAAEMAWDAVLNDPLIAGS